MELDTNWDKTKQPALQPGSGARQSRVQNNISTSSLYLVEPDFNDSSSYVADSRRNSETLLLQESIGGSTEEFAAATNLQSPGVSNYLNTLTLNGNVEKEAKDALSKIENTQESEARKSSSDRDSSSSALRRNNSGKPPLKYHRIRKYDPNDDSFQIQTGISGKPPYSYATLIAVAIKRSPHGRLTLNGIYSWISENFPYYRSGSTAWKNAVRHNLSLNRSFVRVARPISEPGRGAYWAVNPNAFAEHQASMGINTDVNRKPGGPLSASAASAKYMKSLNSALPSAGPKSAPSGNVSSIVSSILQSTGVMTAPLTSGAEVMQVLAANPGHESAPAELANSGQLMLVNSAEMYQVPVEVQGQYGPLYVESGKPRQYRPQKVQNYVPASAVSLYATQNPYFTYGQTIPSGFYGAGPSVYGYYAGGAAGASPMMAAPNALMDTSATDFLGLGGAYNMSSRLTGAVDDADYAGRSGNYSAVPVNGAHAASGNVAVDANGNQVNLFNGGNMLFDSVTMRSAYGPLGYSIQGSSAQTRQQQTAQQQHGVHGAQGISPALSNMHGAGAGNSKREPAHRGTNAVQGPGSHYASNAYSSNDSRRRESTDSSSIYWQSNVLDGSAAYQNMYNQTSTARPSAQQALSISQLTNPAPGNSNGILSMFVQQPSYSSDINYGVNQQNSFLSRSSSFAQGGANTGSNSRQASQSVSSSNETSSAAGVAFLETSNRSLQSAGSSSSSLPLSQSSSGPATAPPTTSSLLRSVRVETRLSEGSDRSYGTSSNAGNPAKQADVDKDRSDIPPSGSVPFTNESLTKSKIGTGPLKY